MNLEELIEKQFVIPVLREKDEETLYSLCMALAEGGMTILEVTLMSEVAYKVIERLRKEKNLIVAAGTVLSADQAKKSLEAGARFLVSPGLDEASAVYARNNNTLFIPGVMTPSEIMRAKSLDLSMVKVFPIASLGGASYIKNLAGPFPGMKWMVTGGILPTDVPQYRNSGVSAVGLGSHLTPKEDVINKDWKAITQKAHDFLKRS